MAKKDELTYKRWKAMKARCYSPSYNKGYNKYQQLDLSYDAVITKKKRTSMAYTEILDYYVIKI